MKNKFLRTFSAVTAALVMALSVPPVLGVNVRAETPENTYTSVPTADDGDTFTLYKYLEIPESANVPPVTFDYSIAKGQAVSATDETMAIKAGEEGLTIGSATFTVGQTTYSEKQDGDTAIGVLTTDWKYAKSSITVTIPKGTYSAPGIYRYVITEEPIASPFEVVSPVNSTLYLDIYVTDTAGTLSIAEKVLHTSDDAPSSKKTEAYKLTDKTDGFKNRYNSYDLTLSKQVSGNQASRTEFFKFIVTINGAQGTVYDVDISHAVASQNSIANNKLTIPEGGTLTQTFMLQHDQYVVIKGLAKGTTYTIQELHSTDSEYSASTSGLINEGYSTSIVRNTEAAVTSREISSGENGITEVSTVAYTNTLDGIVPTGILLTYTPYIIISVIAVAGIIFLAVRRRRNAE